MAALRTTLVVLVLLVVGACAQSPVPTITGAPSEVRDYRQARDRSTALAHRWYRWSSAAHRWRIEVYVAAGKIRDRVATRRQYVQAQAQLRRFRSMGHQPDPPPAPKPRVFSVYVPSAPAARSSACGGSLPPCYVLARESGGNARAENPVSTASGLWQFLDSTWNNYAGYHHASDAPVAVQNAKAAALYDGGRGASHWACC